MPSRGKIFYALINFRTTKKLKAIFWESGQGLSNVSGRSGIALAGPCRPGAASNRILPSAIPSVSVCSGLEDRVLSDDATDFKRSGSIVGLTGARVPDMVVVAYGLRRLPVRHYKREHVHITFLVLLKMNCIYWICC